jgi:hypothetical protein
MGGSQILNGKKRRKKYIYKKKKKGVQTWRLGDLAYGHISQLTKLFLKGCWSQSRHRTQL